MSVEKVPRSVEQRIVIKFLVGENVPSAEIHHRLQQQYGEECLRIVRPILTYAAETRKDTTKTMQMLEVTEMKTLRRITNKTKWNSGHKSVPVIFEPPCTVNLSRK